MQKIFLYIVFFLIPFNNFSFVKNNPTLSTVSANNASEGEKLYSEMKLDTLINFKAFEQAILGYNSLKVKNKGILTLIDFSKPSTQKRFYVLDIKNHKLLYSSYVSHGRNSGENYATSFSNQDGSHKSSLGFYLTENTYQGNNGYSLILEGLEKGVNDQAKKRAIVIHGADYCSESVIKSSGRLGRSFGCPALPHEVSKPIINTIKDGTLLFIYSNNSSYAKHSSVLCQHGVDAVSLSSTKTF